MKQAGYELLKMMGDLDSALIQEAATPLTPAEIMPDGDTGESFPVGGRKSLILRRVLTVAAAVSLIACLVFGMLAVLRLEQENEDVPDDQASCNVPLYSGDDLQAFIEHWLEDPAGQATDFLVVPVLRSDAYSFDGVQEFENKYLYYFRPTENADDLDGTIRIYFNKETGATFEGFVDQHDLTVQNGMAYHDRTNSWAIDCRGLLLHIDFPRLEDADRFSTVTDLFSFVVYTADGESYTIID